MARLILYLANFVINLKLDLELETCYAEFLTEMWLHFRWNGYGDLIHSAILRVVEKGVVSLLAKSVIFIV